MFAMDDHNDDEQPEEPGRPPFELIEAAKQKTSDLEDGARKLGLYMQDSQLAMDPRDPAKMVIVTRLLIGDVAFSDRVQNPQADADTSMVKAMESDLAKGEFETLPEKLLRLRQQAETDED